MEGWGCNGVVRRRADREREWCSLGSRGTSQYPTLLPGLRPLTWDQEDLCQQYRPKALESDPVTREQMFSYPKAQWRCPKGSSVGLG